MGRPYGSTAEKKEENKKKKNQQCTVPGTLECVLVLVMQNFGKSCRSLFLFVATLSGTIICRTEADIIRAPSQTKPDYHPTSKDVYVSFIPNSLQFYALAYHFSFHNVFRFPFELSFWIRVMHLPCGLFHVHKPL